MLGLALDSADHIASAALWRSNADGALNLGARCSIIDGDQLAPEEGKADQLILVVERLLCRQGLEFGDLDVIAVNRGPGSFTGIRSAVALGRGLALATDMPIFGVTSHEAQAALLDPDEALRPLLIALDARRGEVYVQSFAADGRPLSEIEAKTPSAIADDLGAKSWRLAGHGAFLVLEALGDSAKVEMIEAGSINAKAVALVAAEALSAGEPPEKGSALRPLYVRAPDAVPPAPFVTINKDVEVSA